MKQSTHKYNLKFFILTSTAVSVIFFCTFIIYTHVFAQEVTSQNPTTSDEITQLNQQLDEKRNQIKEVDQKKQEIQQQLNMIQKQTYSIQNQISQVNSQVADTEFEIEKKTFEIDAGRLEIEKLATQIKEEEAHISDAQQKLSSLIRLIDQQDRTSALFVLLTRDNFSSYLDDVQSAADIQVQIGNQLSAIKLSKGALDKQKSDQEDIQKQLEEDKNAFERNRETLNQQKSYQEQLLQQSKEQVKPFQELLNQINSEEDYANAQIQTLESSVRERLLALNKGLISNKNVPLSWPVIVADLSARNCASYISCSALFHDQDYRSIFGREHTAVDVPVPQGTPVYAPADGYVVGVVYGAAGGGIGSLSIVRIDHTDDQGVITQLSTKYLHMSKIVVSYNPNNPQFVKKGELIGYSGGLPGTMGSGTIYQSTGPHLHFEVLSSGIPVNPLLYLP